MSNYPYIIKSFKGKKFQISQPHIDEIESFTLLKLNEEEMKELLQAGDWSSKYIQDVGIVYETNYVTASPLYKTFLKLACKHKEQNPYFYDNNLDEFEYYLNSTSMLIRDTTKHIIRIAYKKDNINSLNKIIVCDSDREKFFKDSKQSKYFLATGKYAIDYKSPELYNKWSTFMNNKYFERKQKVMYDDLPF